MSYRGLEYYENQGDKAEVYELIKKLSLFNLFDSLDQTISSNTYVDTCDQKCRENLQKGGTEGLKLLDLCKSFCNIILTTEDINKFCSGSVCDRSCFPTMLWLYNRVLNITESKNIIDNFYEALELIKNSDISVLKKCPIRNFNIDNEIFKIMKFIYEFLYLYDDIKNKISEKYEPNVELYCKYIKENFQYYNSLKKKCTKTNGCKYNSELTYFKTEVNKDEIINFIREKCRYEKTICKDDKTLSNDIPCLKKSENSVKIAISDGDSNNVIKILYMSLLSFASVMGVFSMFYKFTPLGSWLSTKIGKKKNIEKHMNNENYDNSEYLQKIASTYSDNKIYNVKYN